MQKNIHRFYNELCFSQNVKYKSSNSCGHDPQRYIFLVKIDLTIGTFPSFYSVRGGVRMFHALGDVMLGTIERYREN